MIDLDEAEQVGNAATKGPWEWKDVDWETVKLTGPGIHSVLHTHQARGDDRDFIAYARNHWDEILSQLRSTQQLLSALEQCVAFINRVQKDDLPTIQEYEDLQEVAYAAINAAGGEA